MSSAVYFPDFAHCLSLFVTPLWDERFFGQPLPKLPMEWIAPNFLDRTVGPMRLVRLATSGGPAQQDPVGSPVTGAAEPLWIHECFQEVDRVPIDPLPVLGQEPGHPPQQMRGQVRDFDPRQDQEAKVVGDQADVPSTSFR